LAILALFSGYVLRFDSTGQAAGAIAEHLLLDVPVIGEGLNRMFMAVSSEGLNRVYVVHILSGAVCWLMGTWYHVKRVRIGMESFMAAALAGVAFCLFIRAPIDLPQAHLHLIKGPWFFLGIQELLRHLDPLVAGILFPAVPILLTASLPWFRRKTAVCLIFALWIFGYAGATLVGLLRQG
jgi:ubiquinol-cytochrome c reductase cytochrome b subunit